MRAPREKLADLERRIALDELLAVIRDGKPAEILSAVRELPELPEEDQSTANSALAEAQASDIETRDRALAQASATWQALLDAVAELVAPHHKRWTRAIASFNKSAARTHAREGAGSDIEIYKSSRWNPARPWTQAEDGEEPVSADACRWLAAALTQNGMRLDAKHPGRRKAREGR